MGDFLTNLGLERGVQYLSSPDWLPPSCAPAQVLHAIRERQARTALGRESASIKDSSNVVERLAIAYALSSPDCPRHDLALGSLESLGFEVSPEFSELGADALLLMEVLDTLTQNLPVSRLQQGLAMAAIGRLWQAAFAAPPGFDQYIAKSAAGLIGPDTNFFEAAPIPGITGHLLGHYLCRLVDLLQAAIAIKDLPNNRVGPTIALSDWDNPVGSIVSGRGSHKPFPVRLHAKPTSLGPQCERLTLWFVDSESNERIGVARMSILRAQTGMFEEFVDIAPSCGDAVASIINGVFMPTQGVVSLGPRVRRMLDSAENQVFCLGVLEGFYLIPQWRGRGFSIRMLRQLLIEADIVEMVLARPGPFRANEHGHALPFGVQASYSAARLRLASLWHQAGAEYLLNGIMGMPTQAVLEARLRGENDRIQPVLRRPPSD